MALSYEKIADIIKLGHKLGLSSLEIAPDGSLKAYYGHKWAENPAQDVKLTPKQREFAEKLEKGVIDAEESRLKQEQLEEMRLSNPEMYEELVARGDLDDPRQEP